MTLSDLTADLVWPRLLRTGALALRPSRLGVAFFYLIGLMVLLHVADLIDGSERNVLIAAWHEWLTHVHGLVGACVRLDADAGQR